MIKIKSDKFFSFKNTLKRLGESKKSKEVLDSVLSEEDFIKDRVREYIKKRKNLEKVGTVKLQKEFSASLKSCYESMPEAMKRDLSIFHQLLLSGFNLCPYCLLSEPDSCDHYLPKEYYPEFSFFIYNLIPCCTNCNRRKGTRLCEGEHRLFINPIFDEVLTGFIDVDISLNELTISFFVPDISGFLVFQNHVKKLDLIKRFNDQGVAVLTRVALSVEESPELKENKKFKDEMARQFRMSKKIYGDNHCETLIYRKLSVVGHDLG